MASFRKKVQLMRGLFNGQVANTGPFFVTWDIIGRCNLRCIGCPYHTPLKSHKPAAADFPIDVFRRLCNELRELDTYSLVLQGSGEPLLHPNLFRMIQTAKTKGFEVVLLTNGTLLNIDTCKQLIESGVDTLKVSLWSASSEDFEENYPGIPRGMFSKIVDGLNILSDLKAFQSAVVPKTILYFVINRNNYHEIGKAVELALNTRCDGINFSIMHDSSNKVASLMLDKDETRFLDTELSRIEKKLNLSGMNHNIRNVRFRYRIGEFVLNRVPCYISWFHVRVGLDGRVFPCIRCAPEIDFGNVHTHSFKEIWNGNATRAFRRLTMKRNAGFKLTETCDCRYCCFVCDNMRVHRIFRFFRPFFQQA